MLELNPQVRMSASNLMKQKAFESMRKPNSFENCPIQVELDFDDQHKMSDDLKDYEEQINS